jgi:hypothetical protein
MKKAALPILSLLPAALLASSSAAQGPEQVRCSIDYAPDRPCTRSGTVEDGVHHMTFRIGSQKVTFVGRSQTGWWSGELNGRPAMGYERNRGNMIFSTADLETVFAWWYPGQEHGTY